MFTLARSLLGRVKYFQDGTCIVHHLFGGEVCQLVKDAYGDAYLAAHFEVPGEMFGLAMEAKKRGMGVVGSTSQILKFISDVVSCGGAKENRSCSCCLHIFEFSKVQIRCIVEI